MLWTIWFMSLGLAALSLVTMVGLVLGRAIGGRRRDRLARHRRELLHALLAWVEGGAEELEVGKLMATEKALSIDVLVEIFENMRGDAQARLAELAERGGLVDQIREILVSGRVRDRLVAAECLPWFPGAATVTALRLAVGDRQIEVGLAAAAALIDLKQDVPIEALLADRFDHPDSSRRLEDLLARVGRQSPPRLLDLAEDVARSERVRVAALESLAAAGAAQMLERITALSFSTSVNLRAAAARCLGAIGHPGSEQAVRRLLADPAWQVRVRAADAAGAIGAAGLGDALIALVDDENWWVRLRSAEALARLGEIGLQALKAIITDQSKPESAQAAALVLAEQRGAAS